VHVHGWLVLLPAAVPFLVALACVALLASAARPMTVLATALSIGLFLASVVGAVTFLIGFAALPSAMLLVVACVRKLGQPAKLA
jgi:hypothetical protein